MTDWVLMVLASRSKCGAHCGQLTWDPRCNRKLSTLGLWWSKVSTVTSNPEIAVQTMDDETPTDYEKLCTDKNPLDDFWMSTLGKLFELNINTCPEGEEPIICMEDVSLQCESFIEIEDDDANRMWLCNSRKFFADKLVIKNLAIKSLLTRDAVDYLEKYCEIDCMKIGLPIMCPKDCLARLQRMPKEIVFFKLPEIIEQFNLGMDGFVKFLDLPVIKLQFEPEEKAINAVLKQLLRNERPNLTGFYAPRKGKTDKLEVLMDGLEEFVHKVRQTSMGIFFDANIPEIGSLSVSYTTMAFAIEIVHEPVEGDADFCHLVHLNKEVQLAILQQLDFHSFINLALTCRLWYERASTAPRSIKPALNFNLIRLDEDGFRAHCCSDEKSFHWDFNTTFNLVRHVETGAFRLTGHAEYRSPLLFKTAYNHLVSNKEHYKMEELQIIYPVYCEKDRDLLVAFCNLATSNRFEIMEKFEQDLQQCCQEHIASRDTVYRCFEMITECMTQAHIVSRVPVDMTVINEVIKQWIRGDRPNLKFFSSRYNRVEGNPLKKALKGLRKFISSRVNFLGQEIARISIKGRPQFGVFCCEGMIVLKDLEDLDSLKYFWS